MRTTSLLATAATVAIAALTTACTGGEITDPNGNPITGSSGKYSVTFRNTSTGATYSSGVDSNGYFAFDPYAPAGANNSGRILPEGTYTVTVAQAGNVYFTPYTFQHTFNNQSCPDHFNSGSEQCALYQLRLQNAVGTPPAPYATSALGYYFTVVPLEPQHYPSISVTWVDRAFTIVGNGFVPNNFAFFKATGAQTGALYHDQTVTATSAGAIPQGTSWQMCVQGNDSSVSIVAQDEETGLWSNTLVVYPPHC